MGLQSSGCGLWRLWLLTLLSLLVATSTGCSSSSKGGKPTGDGGVPPGNSLLHPCARDNQPCATGTVCEPYEGCVACLFDSDCDANEWCHDNACETKTSCLTDADCAGNASLPACDPHRAACVPCVDDAHCGVGAHCLQGVCSLFQSCTSTSDCASGLVCNPGTGECVGCMADGDCRGGVCLNNTCRPQCTSNADCASLSQICDPLGACVQCTTDADCPSVYHCDLGACEPDVCKGGDVTCNRSTNGTYTCRPDGRSYTAAACSSGTVCDPASGTCTNWRCSPGMASCDIAQNAVMTCSADGLVSVLTLQCATDEVCIESAGSSDGAATGCVKMICTPNQVFCDTATSFATCSADGTRGDNPQTCATGEHCEAGGCVVNICVPDALGCDQNVVKTCDSIGGGFLSTGAVDCGATGQVCSAGACLDIVCAPGAFVCGSDGNRYQCNGLGTASTLYEACASGVTICDDSDGLGARCRTIICTSGSPTCDGNRATVCNTAGTGPAPTGGTDCTQLGQACSAGTCQPIVCSPNSFLCGLDGNQYRCNSLGTSSTLSQTCVPGVTICDGSDGLGDRCRSIICTPGAPLCDGNRLTMCNTTGTGPLPTGGTDCAQSGTACWAGACQPIVCTGATFCDVSTSNAMNCTNNGTTTTLRTTCLLSQYCSTASGTASCLTDVCSSGQMGCTGNLVGTCLPNGSGYDSSGGDCANSSASCVGGVCVPWVCAPGETICSSGNIASCNANRTGYSTSTICNSLQHCSAASGTPTCVADLCAQGVAACIGETAGICAADGSGLTTAGTDCSLSGEVCNESGVCAPLALDTFGATSSSSTSTLSYSNRYLVTEGRTLTQIEQWMTLSAGATLTWVVYESTSQFGTYTQLLSLPVAYPLGATATFVSSGAISVPLVAGRYYMIGAIVTAGSRTMYYQLYSADKFLSFGKGVQGAYFSPSPPGATASPITASRVPYQRLTTVP